MKFAALLALLAFAAAEEPSAIDRLRHQFFQLEGILWSKVTDPTWKETGLGGDVELAKAFKKFYEKLDYLQWPPKVPLKNTLYTKTSQYLQIVDGINENFVGFISRQTEPGAVPAPVREWLDLAETILMDPKTSVVKSIQAFDQVMSQGDIFATTLSTENPDLCEMQLSPHQLIYDLYNSIALTEIKGYAMMQFSWMLLRIYGKGNFTQEASLTRQRYGERTMRTATNAQAALLQAKRDIYRCDPPQHKEGETYAEVTRLMQGYVENEVDMNVRGTCGENCAYYTLTQQYNCYENLFCAKQKPCKGRILNCQYIDSDMEICPASPASTRRYDWIEYENGRTLGKTGSCPKGSKKVDSWWKWNLLHCSYCFCLCEDQAVDTEKFFSLKEAVADHDNNKIVTGLRLVKLGRVFHLQLAEGTLLARGTVAAGGWVPLQNFDPTDQGVAEGVDYHMLSYEKRAIDLDELDSPPGHVLTGVRFRLLGAHLHFEIRSTPFNYTTGQLSPGKSRWLSNDNTDVNEDTPRRKLKLFKPDIPTRAGGHLRVDSSHDQFVEFTNSDLDADAAQSTVPFIDIQPVQPMKGSTIASGAGVIHRGRRGSGGFIGLKLFTYDYSRHVQAEAPPSTFLEDKDTTEFTPNVN